MVWVGSDMRTTESRRGRVVLSVTTQTGEVTYLVRLEVSALNGTCTVTAHARDLIVFPVY
jgi:hypothetical protein